MKTGKQNFFCDYISEIKLDPDGCLVGKTKTKMIPADSEASATKKFKTMFPNRIFLKIY